VAWHTRNLALLQAAEAIRQGSADIDVDATFVPVQSMGGAMSRLVLLQEGFETRDCNRRELSFMPDVAKTQHGSETTTRIENVNHKKARRRPNRNEKGEPQNIEDRMSKDGGAVVPATLLPSSFLVQYSAVLQL
jgi:hypothetical protein